MRFNSLFIAVAAAAASTPSAQAWQPPQESIVAEAPVEAAPLDVAGSGEILPPCEVSSNATSVPCRVARRTCNCPRCCGSQPGWWERHKCRKQEQCWGYPEEFEELPLGCLSNEIMGVQVRRGEQARMTLYHYDFIQGSGSLNSRGLQRVSQLAHLAVQRGDVITIQSADPGLDAERYESVVAVAGKLHGLDPSQVVVGQPIAAGLSGEEALIHHQTHLNNVSRYGVRRFNFGSFSADSQSGGTSSGSSMSSGTSSR